jgi:4-O-beta-D-mannosyl-D-glucose phosphorylase
MRKNFRQRLHQLEDDYNKLINLKNEQVRESNGIYARYKNPVLTAQHVPVFWKYDLNEKTKPFLLERF